jgi:hypothetical protein
MKLEWSVKASVTKCFENKNYCIQHRESQAKHHTITYSKDNFHGNFKEQFSIVKDHEEQIPLNKAKNIQFLSR